VRRDQARLLLGQGYEVRDEDVVRLSPLGFEHNNMLGRYAFILPAPSPVASCGRCETRFWRTATRAESNFQFRYCRTLWEARPPLAAG
jgi:hypothetical protein